MKNSIIRKSASAKRVKLWQIAERLNMADSMFSRKLRHELPDEEREKILAIIEELASEEVE